MHPNRLILFTEPEENPQEGVRGHDASVDAADRVCGSSAATAAGAQEVTKVVNGNTIEVEGVGKIRLARDRVGRIGRASRPVGTWRPPRSGPTSRRRPLIGGSVGIKPEGPSQDALRNLVLGKRVRLEYDEAAKGHGTPRAYVFVDDDTLVNEQLLREGLARVDTSRPFASMARFKALEQEAREGSLGVWADVRKR